MPTLRELEARFIRHENRIEPYEVVDGDSATWRERGCPTKPMVGPREYHVYVEVFHEAQGVFFLCPRCFAANSGSVGTHGVYIWFDGRGAPKMPLWSASGTGLDDLTISPSIVVLPPGCGWHGFVRDGKIVEA